MLTVLSSTCLLFAGCALLYQADERRAVYEGVRSSKQLRLAMRAVAGMLFILTSVMVASLRGWELGIPIWLGLFSLAFVIGLFLSAQKPSWHPLSALASSGLGVVFGLGALFS